MQSFKEHTGTVVSLALASNDEFLVTGKVYSVMKLKYATQNWIEDFINEMKE